MSVLRRDPATGGWVIVAPERSRRPRETHESTSSRHSPCPFCISDHASPTSELLQVASSDDAAWVVRVLPNKFPALVPDAHEQETFDGRLFRELAGVGHHEVIVEGPSHDLRMSNMSAAEIAAVLEAYHARCRALRDDPRVAYIIIFKNDGARAGASLVHPHSQLVAIPMAPLALQQRYARAREHYDATGRCLYCDVVKAERQAHVRVVFETESLVVYCPFASAVPYETWIAPLRHQPSFVATSRKDRQELASVLRRTLAILHHALGGPDFNFVLHTAPVADEHQPYYLWHVQILPRIAQFAGFELGSGMPINATSPEDAAQQLRRSDSGFGPHSAARGDDDHECRS